VISATSGSHLLARSAQWSSAWVSTSSSHASEDKDRFVRPLVEALGEAHLYIWSNEDELRPGDSLIQAVELSRTETGKVNLTWSTVEAIAAALGVSITEVARRASA
jgi:hypothetical protein